MCLTSTQIGCRVSTAAVTHPSLRRGDSAASRPIIFGLTAVSNTDDQTINALIGTTGSIRFKKLEAQREPAASDCYSDAHYEPAEVLWRSGGKCRAARSNPGVPQDSQGRVEMFDIGMHQCSE